MKETLKDMTTSFSIAEDDALNRTKQFHPIILPFEQVVEALEFLRKMMMMHRHATYTHVVSDVAVLSFIILHKIHTNHLYAVEQPRSHPFSRCVWSGAACNTHIRLVLFGIHGIRTRVYKLFLIFSSSYCFSFILSIQLFNVNNYLPTISMSPDTSIVWKEGASADTSQLNFPDMFSSTDVNNTWLAFDCERCNKQIYHYNI